MAWEGRGILKCSIKNDECRMDNMCCNFCVKNRAECVGCDYEFHVITSSTFADVQFEKIAMI